MTWLNSILHWFYGLKLLDAILLVAAVSLLFLLLNQRLGGRRAWKVAVFCLLLAWLAVILWSTVWSRALGEEIRGAILTPFYSYYIVLTGGEAELLRSNFMNALLFYPAGLFTFVLLPRRWSIPKKLLCVAVLLGMLSAGIECIQHFCQIGQAETDDVIHNTLGALFGGCAAALAVTRGKPPHERDH